MVDKNGNPNLKRYKATFDYSKDLIKLRKVYSKIYRNNRFSYIENEREYCKEIINVTFDYSVKEFNRTGKDIFLKLGETLDGIVWNYGLGYKNNSIVAVNVKIESPIELKNENIPSCFYYKDNYFYAKQNIKCMRSVEGVRADLYKNGFFCDGVKYIRWKRSTGSSRVGKCLFIDEKLYNSFHKWEMCGLNIKRGDKVDLAALESCISLTSSSIIDTINILPENILVIDDYESVFDDDVINVTEECGQLVSREERATIRNSIWDGQMLIDKSIMGDYSDKGMILTRNRMYKSCGFNTNIQQWFIDNNITDVSQLNGFTLAKKIEDIKVITTPNSIKYLKFSNLEKWLNLLESEFGIVKYEKPTHFMDGKLVQTHYQLINSIQLTRDEIQELLEPTYRFMDLIKTYPEVLRYWIKFKIENELEVTPVKSKTDVIYKMMSINPNFYKTKLYHDFKLDYLKSFTKDLKCGRVLVNGNYSTLCGNPIEMLKHSIGRFDGVSTIQKGSIYSKRFEWGKMLLGSRSPHITMSNVLLAQNTYNHLIDKYMNATEEIVFVNSIEENILQQLSGNDFDSDTLLLTDNEILIKAAKRNYGKFKIAVCNVGGTKKQRYYTEEHLADLDTKTSKNLIGDIINLSQELNTIIWNKLYYGASIKEVSDIYLDVCKLSVMSGIEIDRAKKEFIINNAKELSILRKKYCNSKDGKNIKPNFFAHIAKQKGYYNNQTRAYLKHNTSMDYLQQSINLYRSDKIGEIKQNIFIPFSDVIDKNDFYYGKVTDRLIHKVLSEIDLLKKQISAIYTDNSLSKSEQHIETYIVRQGFIEYIGELKFNRDTMIALLQTIEKDENKKYRRLLFYTLFGYPNTSFYDIIQKSKDQIPEIKPDLYGDIEIFGHRFSQKHTKMT